MNLDDYAKIATIVAAIGTIFFNLLLWLATRSSARAAKDSAQASKDSAQVAKDSLNFQKEQIRKSEEQLEFQKYFVLKDTRKDARYIYNTVAAVANGKIDTVTIATARNIKRPSNDDLSKYFTKSQSKAVEEIWDLYLKYYSDYWMEYENKEFDADFYKVRVRQDGSKEYVGLLNEQLEVLEKD